jgi:hypothetical protein
MKTLIEQFYSQFREAMFANKLTASDLSERRGVHYTYIYNSIRSNANMTLASAEQVASAAGYRLKLTFEPNNPSSQPLVGNMDAKGPLYSERRAKPKPTTTEPTVASEQAQLSTAADLDSEIDELLASI